MTSAFNVKMGWCVTCDDFIDPFDRLHHDVALLVAHDRRPLAAPDLGIRDEADHQRIPKRFGLQWVDLLRELCSSTSADLLSVRVICPDTV